MVTMEEIQALADRIAREFNPERIILFGSHAYGTPTTDSDVDLLVVLPHTGKTWEAATAIRARIQPTFPLDLLVRSPIQLCERLGMGDTFLTEIVERGKIVYEANYERVGR